jgi:chromosomal replication initiator protein
MAVQQLPMSEEEVQRLWEQVLLSVRNRLGNPQAFDTWFRPIVPREVSPQHVELEVPNAFFVDWIHEHHLPSLRKSLEEVLGGVPEVRFSPREAVPSPPVAVSAARSAAQAETQAQRAGEHAGAASWLESQLHPRLRFEGFVVGSGNRFTHAACLAVARRPGDIYNPLFIFGDSGLGKTHLLHAIGHAVRAERRDARVIYLSAERFTNEMIFAIQHGQTLMFRNKYRNVDVLLIDDIQFLAGKESTQEEFFHTFNALRDAHKQVVVTADKPPKDIPKLEARLTSRFNQGLVADVQQPDLETRIAILRNRCERAEPPVRIPEDVLLLIADRIRTNIRDLEGCLVRLLATASLTHQDIDLPRAEEVLQRYINAELDELTPERILTTVAGQFAVRTDALLGRRRTRNIVLPRQVAMYLMRHLTDLSLVEIGRMFGGKDHTTVIYACQRVSGRIATDGGFAERVNGLIHSLAT